MNDFHRLSQAEKEVYFFVTTFFEHRLEERASVEWALESGTKSPANQVAIQSIVQGPASKQITEPWKSAWDLLIESWRQPRYDGDFRTDVYDIQRRLSNGERSYSLVQKIVSGVSPQLKIEKLKSWHLLGRKIPKKPKKLHEVFSVEIDGDTFVDPTKIGLEIINDSNFLLTLCNALEFELQRTINQAKQLGWDIENSSWRLGGLKQVRFITGKPDPDQFSSGIASLVKLLHYSLMHLANSDEPETKRFIAQWRTSPNSIHKRLWASLSCDAKLTSANEAYKFLMNLSEDHFWNPSEFPEFTELRAQRFSEFSDQQRTEMQDRLTLGPPANYWSKRLTKVEAKKTSLRRAIQEMRRLELTNSSLDKKHFIWLRKMEQDVPEALIGFTSESLFSESPIARFVTPDIDTSFDSIFGADRLINLNKSLSKKSKDTFDNDPASTASAWMRTNRNIHLVLDDIRSTSPETHLEIPFLIDQIGWIHIKNHESKVDTNLKPNEDQVLFLNLLKRSSDNTLIKAMDGICNWLLNWGSEKNLRSDIFEAWARLWPLLIASENNEKADSKDPFTYRDGSEIQTFTLNSNVGKLSHVFIYSCPNLTTNPAPFAQGTHLYEMRETLFNVEGKSKLTVLACLFQFISYFHHADAAWVEKNLFPLLRKENEESAFFWTALSARLISYNILNVLAEQMCIEIMSKRIVKSAQKILLQRMVYGCLTTFVEDPEHTKINAKIIQQALRSVDDETRSASAEVLHRFLQDYSANAETPAKLIARETLFKTGVCRFLNEVWPLELSLSSKGVSKALAKIPAHSGESFSNAVELISRFLKPFDSWSLMEYGLFESSNGEGKLALINNYTKANAFLKLLDLTIAKTEYPVTPHELPIVLAHFKKIAPGLEKQREFRRLMALTRI